MKHNLYLQRCIELALRGTSRVYPNPKVGALLVFEDTIIGEGFHAYIGGPHAEVAAISSVKNTSLIPAATLYVSLEPCNHTGKTPPCTSLIISHRIQRVVVGCLDPNPKVAGTGIQRLREHGVEVILAEDPTPFAELNKSFFVNQKLGRPYITLKYAQTADEFMAGINARGEGVPMAITGPEANVFTHSLRASHHAIMVGRKTTAIDNPRLDVRNYYGENPIRLILDKELKLPDSLRVFNEEGKTWVLTEHTKPDSGFTKYITFDPWQPSFSTLFSYLYQDYDIGSVLVEGGSNVLQQFIDCNLFDQLIILESTEFASDGVSTPVLPQHIKNKICWIKTIGNDNLFLYNRSE